MFIQHGFRPLTGNYISQWEKSIKTVFAQSFRPLTGNYISQWVSLKHIYRSIWFPSPYGELHFSIRKPKTRNKRIGGVSVPLRGTTFLNRSRLLRSSARTVSFPSPYGELHFSIKKWLWPLSRSMWFPSPYGELHFSILTIFTARTKFRCFRPLTGNYISQ